MAKQELRINSFIRAKEIRLIGAKGEQRGILPISEALRIAEDEDLDLVEVSPNTQPPVCKLLDYGKYKFDQEKKQRESRKKQKNIRLKEIRMQPKIDVHDLSFKTKHIREFLEEGNKVKVTIRFRGRELAHIELGEDVLKRVMELLNGDYELDKAPKMEGRFMSMFLSPKQDKKVKNN